MITTALILGFLLLTIILATGSGWNNVLSPDRNDLVFTGRNREYGAYKLRQEHHRTMLIALFTGLGIVGSIILIPSLFRADGPITPQMRVVDIDDRILEIIAPSTKPKDLTPPDAQPTPPKPSDPVIGSGPIVAIDSAATAPLDTTATDPGPTPNPNPGGGGVPGKIPIGGGTSGGDGTGDDNVVDPWGAEKPPEYPGGEKALSAYLSRSIRYPTKDIDERNEGRVMVGFIVRTDGSVTDVNILKGVSPTIDAEALRVVKAMIKWIPGKFNQREANVRYALPIVFKLKN